MDAQTQISEQWQNVHEWSLNTVWDSSRTELFVLPYTYYNSDDEIAVYNWLSGERLASYSPYLTPPRYVWGEMEFALRGNWLVVSVFHGSLLRGTPITVWDRTTQQAVYQVNGGTAGIAPLYSTSWYKGNLVSSTGSELVDISPDGRYLVVGFETLRVWDLATLPENYDERTATYQYPIDTRGMNRLRFIDNTTVEILLDDNITLIRKDILTGQTLD
jgi:hypothetical protein